MKYQGIVISDIHFGAVDYNQLKKELLEVFIYYLENMKKIDFIVFTGDYFDHKLYMNDRNADYALSFMDKIVDIARRHQCPIRLVYGTESHEVNQYNIFSIYQEDETIDFKVINTVTEEELIRDVKVLYIPEEYMFDKKDYYKEFFDKKDEYDYIFGHGVIQEVMTNAVKHSSESKESTRKKVPVFTTGELINICKGQVYFGHYHVQTNIKDKVFYVGSFTRFCHGEEEPKGFYHTTLDNEKSKYTQKFIENYLAKKYITHSYGYQDKIMESEEELLKELDRLDKIAKNNEEDFVRIVVNIPENHGNPEFVMNILNERYKQNENIKLKITNGYVEKKKKINKEKLDNALNDYPMIFDKNIKIEDKIVYFNKKRWDKDIDIENVKKYLYGTNETDSI